MKKFNIYNDKDSLILNNKKQFLTIGNFTVSNGLDLCENIILLTEKEKDFIDINFENYLKDFIEKKGIKEKYIANEVMENSNVIIEKHDNFDIITVLESNLQLIEITNVLKEMDYKKSYINDLISEDKILNIGNIIILKESFNIKEMLDIYGYIVKTKAEFFKDLKIPYKVERILNENDFLILACENSYGLIMDELLENNTNNDLNHLKNELKAGIYKDCKKIIEISDINFGIMDYIKSENIKISDLVDAGMELCVGVEVDSALKEKLEKQILKSLEDLNVIALLMAAIRVEEDFQNNRLREVDVEDDPAYLYTDEVLGLAISNQIAGTKATFNFKRYDEAKPGILKELGPMVDDIFAGLIAGCMSKIFESD